MVAGAMSPPPGLSGSIAPALRRLLVMATLTVAVITAVLAVPTLGSVRAELDEVNGWWAAAAVGLEVASCAAFVVVFRAFFDSVTPGVARRVAWIEEGSGALLPGGGITSYAIGGLLLGREGLGVREIVVRSGGLFWFTSAVNVLALVIGTGLLLLIPERGEPGLLVVLLPLAVAAPLTVLIASAPALGRGRRVGRGRAKSLIDGVAEAWRGARGGNWRLLGALGYLYFDMAVLACLFRGVGYAVPFGALTLGYLVGYLATMIPIPGGIGVLEGGLAGALILYGTPPVRTVAVVLVYHAIAFWIPSLGGAIGYASLVRRRGRTVPRLDRPARQRGEHPTPAQPVAPRARRAPATATGAEARFQGPPGTGAEARLPRAPGTGAEARLPGAPGTGTEAR
jgi:uncharacterized membrane protein YbhN (UPF0104 family)